jgi:predicted RNA methylase
VVSDIEVAAAHKAADADKRQRQEDLTPRGVSRAVLKAMHEFLVSIGYWSAGLRVIRVLDVCAGFGGWASEFRRLAASLGWEVHITGIELDPTKADHLLKWCDAVVFGDYVDALRTHHESTFDLVIGNPHFTGLTSDAPQQSMPAILLRHAAAVLLFHQEQSFQKSKSGAAIWHAFPPAAVFCVPGAVRFREGKNPATGKPYGTDARCYQATLWLSGHAGPVAMHMLPWIDASGRRWQAEPGRAQRAPPGTEEPNEELPAAPGWAP